MSTEQHQVVVIGAGPAGLAVGACLKRLGLWPVLLERADSIASRWRGHYERLHLHSDRRHSELPYRRFPRGTPRYPSRRQVIDYLEAYAHHFALPVRFGCEVQKARRVRDGGDWLVMTDTGTTYRAPAVVVASGYNAVPKRPHWPGEEAFGGSILHSGQYREGSAFEGQRVLVVGFGNSGAEIALDLHEHGARPALSLRSPVNVVPRQLFGIPILTVSIALGPLSSRFADRLSAPLLRLALGNLEAYGLRRPAFGPVTQIRTTGRIPPLDIGTVKLIKSGAVAVRPGVTAFHEDGVTFEDDISEPFDAVILATGFSPGVHQFLDLSLPSLNAAGIPVCCDQCPDAGLHFCGFRVSATGMLRDIAIEARRIAAAIYRSTKVQPGRRRMPKSSRTVA